MLTANEFADGAKAFAAAWQEWQAGGPLWTWLPMPAVSFASDHGGGHLFMQGVPVATCATAAPGDDFYGSSSSSSSSTGVESETLPAMKSHKLHLYSHSIAYNLSYREPVLYFEATDSSGAPLTLDAVLADLQLLGDAASSGGLQLAPSTEIETPPAAAETHEDALLAAAPLVSREEHPLLGRPLWMLHPCQTGAVMRLLLRSSKSSSSSDEELSWPAAARSGSRSNSSPLRYMMAWWSVQAQAVGMPLPHEAWQAALADR